MQPLPQQPQPRLIPSPDTAAPSTTAPTPVGPSTSAPDVDIQLQPPPAEVDYAKLIEKLKADTEFMAAVKGEPGEPGEPGPMGPAGPQGQQGIAGEPGPPAELTDDHLQRIVAGVADSLKSDSDFIALVTPSIEIPTPDTGAIGNAAVADFAGRVWLYYTSSSAPELKEVDEKIQALRNQGYPIIVTYLTPQQATVMGVPMIFVPATGKKVVGISNCTQFLARQIPR